ncbi:hypothetical protein GF312_21955, partial [Candidatus Poribacteria bacterium]|nr:hypothetical protein [Candidatus Poribacteria bacterium]
MYNFKLRTQSALKRLFQKTKLIQLILPLFIFIIPQARSAVLQISAKNIDGTPISGAVFQVFPSKTGINEAAVPVSQNNITDGNGRLNLNLPQGEYKLVGSSSSKAHFVYIKKVSVPGRVNINLSEAVMVGISCQDMDNKPIIGAEIFMRPTKLAKASVGLTNNEGKLTVYAFPGKYNAILRSLAGEGPHYLVLPDQTVGTKDTKIEFHVASIPSGQMSFQVPAGTALAIFEVLESDYTFEYTEGVEPEVGYDAAYTDFYPFISTRYSFTLSANISYNFNMSFAVMFGFGKIYAYEIRPSTHIIKPGTQQIGITESAEFNLQALWDKEDAVYNPGDKVNLSYYFNDNQDNLLNRILDYTGARLIFPQVTIWDPNNIPIANNFDTDNFFEFEFQLPLSATTGQYKARISLDAGIYGNITDEFQFQVKTISDNQPPSISQIEYPDEIEAGQSFTISANIRDNQTLKTGSPILEVSGDGGQNIASIEMDLMEEDIYTGQVSQSLVKAGELNWKITARDTAGNTTEKTGSIPVTDNTPPVINHEIFDTAEFGQEIIIQADITDNSEVNEAALHYKVKSDEFTAIQMVKSGNTYSAPIPSWVIAFDGFEYYIQADDKSGNSVVFPEQASYVKVEDTIPPQISHVPQRLADKNKSIRIEAVITDNNTVANAFLYYKNSQEQEYTTTTMTQEGQVYFAEIPREGVIPESLYYYIQARDAPDNQGNFRTARLPVSGDGYLIQIPRELAEAITSIEISPLGKPDSPVELEAGSALQLDVIGYDASGNPLPIKAFWNSTGGIGYIDQDGLFTASGKISGDGRGAVIAMAQFTGIDEELIQSECYIHVKPGPVAYLKLIPDSLSIPAGKGYNFLVLASDVYQNQWEIHPDSIEWGIDNHLGNINNGYFAARTSGTGNITAEINGITAEGRISVTPGPVENIRIVSSLPYQNQDKPTVELKAGQTTQFTTEAQDAYGNILDIVPVWSIQGNIGHIKGDGTFLAHKAGTGKVSARTGDINSDLAIQVLPGKLHSITVSPHNTYLPASTSELTYTQRFYAQGKDAASNPVSLVNVVWTTDEMAGTISPSGLFTSIKNPGQRLGEIVTNGTIWANGVSSTGDRALGSATIVIQKTPPGSLSSLNVYIEGSTDNRRELSLATGEALQFKAVGKDEDGRSIFLYPSWFVEGDVGYIDSGGLFTALRPGTGSIGATSGGLTGKIKINITLGTLNTIEITPDNLTMTLDSEQILTATGFDSFGNIFPAQDIQWSAIGDSVEIIPDNNSCLVKAINAGHGTISARVGDIIGFASVYVPYSWASVSIPDSETPQDYKITIEPNPVYLTAGSQYQFLTYITGKTNGTIEGLAWTTTGGIGTIDNTGLFTAGPEPASGRIILNYRDSTVSALVTVTDPIGSFDEIIIWPHEISINVGDQQKLIALGRQGKKLISILPAWSVIGNTGTLDSTGIFKASTTGSGKIKAILGSLTAECIVDVLPAQAAEMEIQPSSIQAEAGSQNRISVICKDNMGNPVNCLPFYQMTGELGSIDQNGIFTAGKSGSGKVTAIARNQQNSILTAEAELTTYPRKLSEITIH